VSAGVELDACARAFVLCFLFFLGLGNLDVRFSFLFIVRVLNAGVFKIVFYIYYNNISFISKILFFTSLYQKQFKKTI